VSAHHTRDLLGDALQTLAPLVAAAVEALDVPGARSLRRKLDREFHAAIGHYGTARRMETPEAAWPSLRLPQYQPATEAWPGRAAFEARQAKAKAAAELVEPVAVPVRGHGLRLVIDNGRAVAPVEASTAGGAA